MLRVVINFSQIAIITIILCVVSPTIYSNQIAEPQKLEESIALGARPWWIGDLLTVLSIIAGFGLIAFQLRRQHQNDIKTQRENSRDRLRLEIYQEFSSCLDEANNKTSKASGYAFNLTSSFSMYSEMLEAGLNAAPISQRANEFTELHSVSNRSVTELTKLTEKYEIVSPELEIFKLAFNVATYDLTQAYMALFPFLLKVLPIDRVDTNGNTQIGNARVLSKEEKEELNRLVENYYSVHGDLGGYLFDMNLELQKIFLSKLFDNKVKERKPIDPECIVISTEPSKIAQLKKYFENETPWGKNNKKVESRLKDQYETP